MQRKSAQRPKDIVTIPAEATELVITYTLGLLGLVLICPLCMDTAMIRVVSVTNPTTA
jgi:hypothetical protein